MLSIVVLISGSGSNLRALLEACDNPLFPAKILAVGSDKAAAGLSHAEEFGVPAFVVEPELFDSREQWSQVLLRNVQYHNPDLVILAGFMKVLPEGFVSALSPKLINMHPSLLPAFPGAHAVRDALSAGESTTGATVHIVDSGVDTGPVLAQREIAIAPGIAESGLHEQIKTIERSLIVEVVSQIAEGKLNLSERAN